MEKYLKMSDVFSDSFSREGIEDMLAYGYINDQQQAYAAHAVAVHDNLVEENEKLKAELGKLKGLVDKGKEETVSKLLDLKDWNWPQNAKYVCMEYEDEYLQFHSSPPSCNFNYCGFEDNNSDEIIRLFHGTYHSTWVTSVVSKEEYETAKEKLKHSNKQTVLDNNVK